MKAHLGADLIERLGQEACGTHLRLDRPKRMFGCLSAHAHLVRIAIEPHLHRLDNRLVLPAFDSTF